MGKDSLRAYFIDYMRAFFIGWLTQGKPQSLFYGLAGLKTTEEPILWAGFSNDSWRTYYRGKLADDSRSLYRGEVTRSYEAGVYRGELGKSAGVYEEASWTGLC